MRFRVLDIETIPDMSVWTQGEKQYRLIPTWNGRLDAKLVEPFPPPHACRVVAISHVDILMDIKSSPRYRLGKVVTNCVWSGKTPADSVVESLLLQRFADAMGSDGEPDSVDPVILVTWNGRTFDLPVLSMRSFKHGVPFGWYYKNRDMRYRYSDTGHLDLMDYLGDYGAGRNAKLGDVARLIGLPGKIDMTGESVLGIYQSTIGLEGTSAAEEKMKSVATYCLQDTIETAIIFLRSRFHLGKIDKDEHNLCLETFAQSPEINQAIKIDWPWLRLT